MKCFSSIFRPSIRIRLAYIICLRYYPTPLLHQAYLYYQAHLHHQLEHLRGAFPTAVTLRPHLQRADADPPYSAASEVCPPSDRGRLG